MTARTRIAVGAVAVVCGLVTVGLIVLVFAADLETANRTASIVGAVATLVGTTLSVYALYRTPGNPSSVEARQRGVAAGGSIGRAVTGDSVQTSGPAPVPPATPGPPGRAGPIRAGERGVAAGDDIGEAITGDGP
ncbi:hypothetical protein OG979_08425 [Actinomadura citrea]|uniref:hypothetical protein n=1 Tax=Actinomadura citrea TaxID=46158 RepID=UPI002E29F236|nr:hypothetical protein [Actinomadura citrea]